MDINIPPKPPAMDVLTVRLPDRMRAWLDSRAAIGGVTRSDILRLLIIAEIEREDAA